MKDFLKRNLAVLVVIGAALDLFVFGFQLELQGSQSETNAKSECWSTVLDNAVKHPPRTPAAHAALEAEARGCVNL